MVGTATVVGLWGLFLVWLSEPFNPWYFLAYAGPVFVAQAVFTYQRDRIDATLFAPAVLLSGMGLIMVARLAPQLLGRQLCAYLLGLVGFGCLSLFGAKMPLKKMGRPLGLLGAGLLFVTALFGVQAGGSRAWLHFSSFTFQPTELFKLLLILYLVAHVSKEGTPVVLRDRRGFFSYRDLWGPPFGLWLCSLLALGLQRDLGGVLLISGIFWGMLYLVDGRWTTLLAGGALGFVGLLLATYLFPHGRTRLADWLSLWRERNLPPVVARILCRCRGRFYRHGLRIGTTPFHSSGTYRFRAHGPLGRVRVVGRCGFAGDLCADAYLLVQKGSARPAGAGASAVCWSSPDARVTDSVHCGWQSGAAAPDGHYPALCQLWRQFPGRIVVCPWFSGGPPRGEPTMAGTIKGLNRLGKLFIGCILMLILAGGFFQVVWAPSLARSAGNPRIQTLREQIIRGGIFDYQGRVLAQAGVSSGRYTGPRSLGAIVGYDHRVLGQSGLEQAYDQHLLGLTGASLYLCQWRLFKGEKHYGNHLRLTIDVGTTDCRGGPRGPEGSGDFGPTSVPCLGILSQFRSQ